MTYHARAPIPAALPPNLIFHEDFFLSLLGLERDAPFLAATGMARHATRAFRPALGQTEGAYYRIKRRPDGALALKVKYWHQDAGMANACPNIIDLDFGRLDYGSKRGFYYLKSGDFLGHELAAEELSDPAKVRAIFAACQEMLGGIAEDNHHIPDVPAIAARYGLDGEPGDLQALLSKRTYPKPAPDGRFRFLVPRWFFPALLGIGPDVHGYNGKPVRHSQTVKAADGGALLQRDYTYRVVNAAQQPFHAVLQANIALMDLESSHPYGHELVHLEVMQAPEHKDLYEIRIDTMLGEDWHKRLAKEERRGRIDHDDLYGFYGRALRFVSRLTRLCRADSGQMAVLERQAEATLSDILHHNGIYDLLQHDERPPYYKKGMASTFQQLGGATETRVLEERETGIGSNAKKHAVAYRNSRGREFRRALLIDGGSTFLERGLMTADLARHFRHAGKPDTPVGEEVLAWVLTHGHADHVDLVAYVVKSGYLLPPLVLTPLTLEYVVWKLRDLKVDRSRIDSIRANAVLVDFDTPAEGQINTNGVIIERTTETIIDPAHPSRTLYCPRLSLRSHKDPVDAFTLRIGPAGHSLPGLMLDVITRDATGATVTTRHSSDVKLDDTLMAGHPTSRVWLSARKADYLCLESTNAGREGRATPMAEISETLAGLIASAGPDKRHNFGLFASKLDQMMAIFEAVAIARKRLIDVGAPEDTLAICVMDGQNMIRSARNLNAVGLPEFADPDPSDKAKLKNWLKDTHGITLLLATDKAAKALYREGRMGSYFRLVTGPNDEPMSTLYRESRDMLDRNQTRGPDDIYYDLQGRIPVGDIPSRKKALKSRMINEHGVEMHDADGFHADTGTRIAESGHGCADDLREIISLSAPKTVLSEHGSRIQRDALSAIAKEFGACAPAIRQDTLFALDAQGGFEPLRPVPERRLYIDDFDAGPYAFLNRENYQITPLSIAPRLHTDLGNAIWAFERAQGFARGADGKPQLALRHPLRISESADDSRDGDPAFPAFGIETNRYDEVAIHTITGMDHEATDAVYPYSFECAFIHHEPDGTPRREAVYEQVLPAEAVMSPGAVMVTRRDPYDLHAPADASRGRFDPPEYAEVLAQEITGMVRKKTVRDARNRTRRVPDGDALLVLHNARYDLPLTSKELFWNGILQDRPWAQKGIVTVDTLPLARMIHALKPAALETVYDIHTQRPSFRLEDLCRANGVAYDTAAAHGAAHDARAAVAFFQKCRQVAPEIVNQYLWLASDRGRKAKMQMLGIDAPHDSARPVVACVHARAGQVTVRPGILIRVTDEGRTGIFANPQYDLPFLLSRQDEELVSMIRDPECSVFFTVPLDGQGMFAPLSLVDPSVAGFDMHPALVAERERAVRDARVARRLSRLIHTAGRHQRGREVYDDHLIDRKMQVYAKARRYRGLIRESGEIVRYFNTLAKGIRGKDRAEVATLLARLKELPDPDARDVARKLIDRFGRAVGADMLEPADRAQQDAANAWEANGPAEAPNMTTSRAFRELRRMTELPPKDAAERMRAERMREDPVLVRIFAGYARYLQDKQRDASIALTDARRRLHVAATKAARKNRLFNIPRN